MAGKVPARLNVMTFGVRDPAKMKRFYEALGWPSQSVGDEWVGFETGGAMLALYPLDRLAEEANMTPEDTEKFAGCTCAVNVEEENMVDDAIEAAREAGGRVLAEPTDREWGGRSGYFADPEGNVWEIAWAPGSAFDERGALIL